MFCTQLTIDEAIALEFSRLEREVMARQAAKRAAEQLGECFRDDEPRERREVARFAKAA